MNGSLEANGPLLYIVHEYPPIIGGTGVFVSNIARETGRERKIAVLTASEAGGTRRESLDDQDIIRIGIPFRDKSFHYATIPSMLIFVVMAIWHGWRAGRKTRFSGIHAFHLFPSGAAGIILSRLLGIPCFITAIGAEVYDPSSKRRYHSNPLYRRMIAGIMKRAVRLSAISTDIAARMREYGYAGRIDILPPGIPAPPRRSAHRPAGRPHPKFTICSVSRLARRKGLDRTIRAIALLRDVPVRYLIIGDGNERRYLEDLAADLGIQNRTEFLGVVSEEEKFDILAGSDVFVLPSLHEGFGISYIEAMSVGLPVIAGRSGGHTDFILGGENGILLESDGEDELAGAISRLYLDPGLREAMGTANREKARNYHTEALKDLYLAHYRSGTGSGPSVSRCG
jgi:glycosyltransferase involved in cell wall biosynthesis